MNATHRYLLLAAILSCGLALMAETEGIREFFDKATEATGRDYETARNQIVRLGAAAAPELKKLSQEGKDWQQKLVARACLAWIEDLEAAEEVYRVFREADKSEPRRREDPDYSDWFIVKRLKPLGERSGPFIMEILVKLHDEYEVRHQAAGLSLLRVLKLKKEEEWLRPFTEEVYEKQFEADEGQLDMEWLLTEAACALGALADARALPLITRLHARAGTWASLPLAEWAKRGPEALAAIREETQAKEATRRDNGYLALDYLGGEVSKEELARILFEDPKEKARWLAAKALRKRKSKNLVEVFLKATNDRAFFVRTVACEALGELGDRVAIHTLVQRARKDCDVEVAAAAMKSAVQIDAKIAAPLLLPLLGQACSPIDSSIARAAASAMGKDAVPEFLRILGDKGMGDRTREAVLEALALCPDPRAIPALEDIAKHGKPILAREALTSLSKIDDPKVLGILLDCLERGNMDAARLLGELGVQRAAPQLIEALKSPDWCVRAAAIDALKDLKTQEAVSPITERLLKDPDHMVRGSAIRALSELAGHQKLREFMPMLLTEKSDDICGTLVDQLKSVLTEADLPLLLKAFETNPSARPSLVGPLLRFGDRKVHKMLEDMADPEHKNFAPNLVSAIVYYLGEYGTLESIPVLEKPWDMRSETASEEVKEAIAKIRKRAEQKKP